MKLPSHVVVIEWRDAWFEAGAKKADEARSYMKVTTGFLIQEIREGNDPGVLIAFELNETQSRETRQWIPLQMITRMRRYKVQ
jgi:hypothetical protein